MRPASRNAKRGVSKVLFFPKGDGGYPNISLERFRTSIKYQDRPAAADIAFCVAAYANGMSQDRIEQALEDDYLSRDPSPSKRAAYIRRTMEKASRADTCRQVLQLLDSGRAKALLALDHRWPAFFRRRMRQATW